MTAGRTVQALRVSLAPHRVGAALVAGRWRPELYHGGTGSPLRLTEIDPPDRPDGWVRVQPTLAGICASDRKMLHLTGMGTTLLSLYGLPRGGMIPGHEVVGVVTEAPSDAAVAEGDRVVVEPLLSCRDKGFAPCARCEAGDDHVCEHFADGGNQHPGAGFGLNARYGGGWCQELVAPAHRAFKVPDTLGDREAVLAEPFAIGVHAVARNLPRQGARALVIGPGPIGLSVVYALRALAPDVQVTVAGLDEFSDGYALRAGADGLIHGTEADLIEGAAQALGSPVRGNRISGSVLEDGFDVIFDCVGVEQTLDDAFRLTRPRGLIVLVGTSTRQPVDWSLVWHRELAVRGTVYYGTEDVTDRARLDRGARRAMALALEVLDQVDASDLVTHVYPLEQCTDALATASRGPGAQAVKVAFAPQGG